MSTAGFDRNLGASPIRAGQPAGENPRDGEAYAAMRVQIDQLTDIHASAVVDWNAVARLGTQILNDEGKDLSVGAWLALALLHTRALAGLADGVHVLRDLVTTYWDEMSPPAARLRGRRNQMQWLLDQLGDCIQDPQAEFAALQPDVHSELLADWEALDAAWQQHDNEAPAFYGLRAALTNLPVERPAEPAPEAAASGSASAGPASAPVAAAAAPAAGSDPEAVAEAGLASLRPLIDWYLEEHPTLPLLFRLNRICAWAALEQAPPAQNGATRLPPPPDQVMVGFEKIAQGGDPQAVIHFAESRLIGHRYWLDLNRASHAALSRLGAKDAALSVAFETGRLLSRLPQLADMKFSDGRPFADPDTQAWLEALGSDAPRAAGGAAGADPVAELAAAADADAVAGKLNEALDNLQSAARHAGSQRDNFRLRLAQCALLQRFDARADMRPLLATLIEELDAHRLATWEPDLARQALKLAAAVELRYGASGAGPNESMLARLASLDLRAAWQLSQSTAAA
ncbi:type VI secretion system protein TssA [Bordetella petrii]|uniref:type VI secretion system protein TssA n=1 Tax=Bordetella petrii TaxID=94624 RepID=UPI001A976F2B|nr:type VI secretion system protein TssA [Bordetella petrii]